MNAGRRRISVAVLLWAVAGCGSLGTGSEAGASGSGKGDDTQVAGAQEFDFSGLDERIAAARRAEVVEGHLDAAPLLGLLMEYQGNLDATTYICEHFGWATVCWRGASSINPDLRDEMCTLFIEDLSADYLDGDDWNGTADEFQRFLDGHEEECQLGLPHFIY